MEQDKNDRVLNPCSKAWISDVSLRTLLSPLVWLWQIPKTECGYFPFLIWLSYERMRAWAEIPDLIWFNYGGLCRTYHVMSWHAGPGFFLKDPVWHSLFIIAKTCIFNLNNRHRSRTGLPGEVRISRNNTPRRPFSFLFLLLSRGSQLNQETIKAKSRNALLVRWHCCPARDVGMNCGRWTVHPPPWIPAAAGIFAVIYVLVLYRIANRTK